jgi:serine/threonine protein kinase
VLTPGSHLDGRYDVIERLAAGGMGEVYRARRTMLGDEVVIKVIRAIGDDGPTLRERFLRESRTCARLRHPNIVTILDFSIAPDGQPYLVMEYLNGPSLRDELATNGPMALPRVQAIVTELCSALQLAHDEGIVHRDLKPANVVSHTFATGETVFKVIDFGLSNLRAESETRLTQAHQFMGTLQYAAPEQLQGEEAGPQADIYSLGAMVFEMLTGRPPFDGGSPAVTITKHLYESPPAPSRFVPGLPPFVDHAVGKALTKDRAGRWPSMAAFSRALVDDATVARPCEPAPDLAGKYVLGERIASGRLGSEIYKAVHRALGVPVAVRILRRSGRADWEAVTTRFLNEARSLQVAHPSVLQVRDFGEDADRVFVVTDLVEGKSLQEVLAAEGALDWTRTIRLATQLIDGAHALHKRHAWLCGLHPGIIRMTSDEDGERLLISTGGISQVQELLASLSDAEVRGGELRDRELPYIAPEVLTGAPVDARADVFTDGALIYEMATGVVPFTGRSLPELIGRMLRAPARAPREVSVAVPSAASACLLTSLERDPSARHQTMAGFRDAWRQSAGTP